MPSQASPGITIVASQPANWERDQGFNVFQNMLQAHADIDTVFAASDLMALGAIEAIAAAGKTGKIRVIGFDALDDAKKAIAAGTMEASVAQFPAEMGRVAVESAVKVIRGEPVPAETKVKLEMVTKATLGPDKSRALTITPTYHEGHGFSRGDNTWLVLNIGLIGVGRLGRVYARDLAGRIPETRLVAVADPAGTSGRGGAAEFEVPHAYTEPMALIDDSKAWKRSSSSRRHTCIASR